MKEKKELDKVIAKMSDQIKSMKTAKVLKIPARKKGTRRR